MSKFKVGDKVRILDGSNIENYTGSWSAFGMDKYIGEVHAIKSVDDDWSCGRVSYKLEGVRYVWDERGLKLVEGEPTEPQTAEKRITREEFTAAVHAVISDMANDPALDGMARFIIPLTGMTFASKMEEILFGKKED